MKIKTLSEFFEKIENTSSRLEMTKLLALLFSKTSDSEIPKVLYLLQGRINPLFERTEFNMGEKMIIKAFISYFQIEKKLFISRNAKEGDIGKTIEYFKRNIPSLYKQELSIDEVFLYLQKIAEATGIGSQDRKAAFLGQLLEKVDPLSARYIVRIILGTMRLGFSDMTILDALSWMLSGDKSLRPKIERAYHVRPDIGYIGYLAKKKGIVGFNSISPKIFTPIIMMRAERLNDYSEIYEKAKKGFIEPKYDGFRLQVHYKKNSSEANTGKSRVFPEVRLFSRNLEDVTYMYPDIVDGVIKEVKAKEAIFEGEAVGYDLRTGKFLPFQQTVQRKRKYDISKKSKEIPLKLFVFDLLYINGRNLLTVPFFKRRTEIEKIITSDFKYSDIIFIAPQYELKGIDSISKNFQKAISEGLEGIMIKKYDGVYQPGARGWNWIKFKKSYTTKLSDTIDCLILGYDLGKGKRTNFGIGAFLVGVYDEKEDLYKTIAKIGTGLTDEQWKEMKSNLDKFSTNVKPSLYLVNKYISVDEWIKPKIVVEIRADEITRSPVHTAGFALRFPRFEKIRFDKRPEDVTTLKEIVELFNKQ